MEDYESLARGWAESFSKLFGRVQEWGGEINNLLASLGAETIEIPTAPPITEAINTGLGRLKAAVGELRYQRDLAVGQVKRNEAHRGLMAALRRDGLYLQSDKRREVIGWIVDETISTEKALQRAKEAGWTSERHHEGGREIATRPPLSAPPEWMGEDENGGEETEAATEVAEEVGDPEDEVADEPAVEGEDTGDFVPDSPGDEPPAASPPIEAIKAATKPPKRAPAKKAAPAKKTAAKKATPTKKAATTEAPKRSHHKKAA